MNNFRKKFISFVVAMVMSVSVGAINANAADDTEPLYMGLM